MVLNLLFWVIFGALVGWVTMLLVNTGDESINTASIFAGVVGAISGGLIFYTLSSSDPGNSEINHVSLLVSVLGALIVIFCFRTRSRG